MTSTHRGAAGLALPVPPPIVARIDAVARACPAALAMRSLWAGRWTSLSRRELVDRTREHAARLQTLDVRPGDRVALVAECPFDLVLALLGVLRAGAVATPMDPALPGEDAAAQLGMLQPRLVLAARPCFDKLRDALLAHPVVEIQGSDWLNGRQALASDPEAAGSSGRPPALILFTSGTTGTYKGVVLDHEAVVAAFEKGAAAVKVVPHDRCLSLLPAHHIFPLVSSYLTPLMFGVENTIVSPTDPVALAEAAAIAKPTIMPVVPRVLDRLCARVEGQFAAQRPGVRQATEALLRLSGLARAHTGLNPGRRLFARAHRVLGGAPLRFVSGGAPLDAHVRQVLDACGFDILEGYGLTETCGGISVTARGARRDGTVGALCEGMEVRIDPVDQGPDGEVVVRSSTLMRGYFRDEAATREVLADGWLRTGDLGRFEGGRLRITGRLKELIVTASGKKVVSAELDRRYGGIPGVAQLAVVGVCGTPGAAGEKIHAAIVLDPAGAGDAAEAARERVRAEINARAVGLPTHLRVQKVHFVDSLPVTTLGKVRRNMLAEQLRSRELEAKREGPAAPSTEGGIGESALERRLCLLVAQACRLDPATVRADGSLVEFGLDSLGAVDVVQGLVASGVPLRLEDLKGATTLREVCRALEGRDAARTAPVAPGAASSAPAQRMASPAAHKEASRALGLTQRRFWSVPSMRSRYNVTMSSLLTGAPDPSGRERTKIDPARLEQSLREVARRYENLRTRFVVGADGVPRREIDPEGVCPFQVVRADPSRDERELIEERVALNHARSFSSDRLPLFACELLLFAPDRAALVFTTHHLLMDGESMALLARALLDTYESLTTGAPGPAPLEHSFSDFVEWEQTQVPFYEESLAFWRKHLDGAAPILVPKVACTKGFEPREHPVLVPKEATQALKDLAARCQVPWSSMLMAVLNASLFHRTGKTDLLVGSASALRNHPITREVVGPVASAQLFRTRLSPDMPFDELVRAEAALMIENNRHRLPIAFLVERLFPDAYRERTEITQVQLDLLPEWKAPEGRDRTLHGRPLVGRADNFQFELVVEVSERDGALLLNLAYNALAVEPDLAAALGDSMRSVIERVVREPGTPVRELA